MQITKKTVASKHRKDSGWIVSFWSTLHNIYYQSEQKNYLIACRMVREFKKSWDTKNQSYIKYEERAD